MKLLKINNNIVINIDNIFSVRLDGSSVFIHSCGSHGTEHKFDNEQDAIASFNDIFNNLKEAI